MRPKGVLLIGAAISTIVLSQTALARDDSAPFVVAQQDQNKDKNKNKNQNQNQNRNQNQGQGKQQRQEGRQERRDQNQGQRQERREQNQGQRQERRDQKQEQKQQRQDTRQEQRRDNVPRDQRGDQRKDLRQDQKQQRQDVRQKEQQQRQELQQRQRDEREKAQQQQRQQREEREKAQQQQRQNQEGRRDQRDGRPDNRQDGRQDSRQDNRQDNRQENRQEGRRDGRPGGGDDRARKLDDVRGERREFREGNRKVIQEGSRAIVQDGNRKFIRHDENERFRRGRDVSVQRVGGETRTFAVGPGGSRVVSVTDANGRLLRRSRYVNGREVIIIDNRPRGGRRADAFFIGLGVLPALAILGIPRERYIVEAETAPPEYIYGALMAPPVEAIPRAYTLDEIRYSPDIRDRMPRVDLDTITFESGSWEVPQDQYNRLAPIADGITRAIAQNPNEVFLIEGHTDATGNDDDNLSLSDRRAESVSVILTDQFKIPPENLTTQGYGEQQLKVQTQGPERVNRRVTVRRITPLLQQGQAGADAAPGGPGGQPGGAPPQ